MGSQNQIFETNLKKNLKMKTFGLLVIGGAVGLKFEDLTFDTLKSSFNQAVPKVFGNKNLDTAIIGNDYVPFFKWCDANNDGSVALFESARCGSKVSYWFPSSVGWFDWATYATTISLDMTTIMMKYMNNIDRDISMFSMLIRMESSPEMNFNYGENFLVEESKQVSQ